VRYFIDRNGDVTGPFGEEQLRDQVTIGKVSASTLVVPESGPGSEKSKPEWRPLGAVLPALFSAASTTTVLSQPSVGGFALPAHSYEMSVPLRASTGVIEVEVVNIRMRFWSMVGFMVKWTIASIPAFLILVLIAAALWSSIAGIVAGLLSR
jgi:hypothetical protein